MFPQNGAALPAEGRSLTSCWHGRQRGYRHHTDDAGVAAPLPAVPARVTSRVHTPHAGAIAARAGYPLDSRTGPTVAALALPEMDRAALQLTGAPAPLAASG